MWIGTTIKLRQYGLLNHGISWVLPVWGRTGGLTWVNNGAHDAGEAESDDEDIHGVMAVVRCLRKESPLAFISLSSFSCEDEKPAVELASSSLRCQNVR